jgi:hypothetical protein
LVHQSIYSDKIPDPQAETYYVAKTNLHGVSSELVIRMSTMQDPACRLCCIVDQDLDQRKVQDAILSDMGRFQWIPGLGAFVEGYSLIISKDHILNTGCLTIEAIRELRSFIMYVQNHLHDIYGTGCVTFEHGVMGPVRTAGSCVDHHHIHIFPLTMPTLPLTILRVFTDVRLIEGLEDLIRINEQGTPYIYYQTSSGTQYVISAPVLPRQYMRQVLATELGCPHDWNWQTKPFLDRIHTFVSKAAGKTPACDDANGDVCNG